MILSTIAAASFLPAVVLAQYNYGPPSGGGGGSSSSSAPAAAPSAPADTPGHLNVDVAFNGFVFHPANISAPNGTLVTFWFPNTGIDHSVTQSSFAAPCTYLAATSNTSAGFDSGLTHSKTFTLNITDDTKPIWFHCKQVQHCGMGMVGSINAPSTGNTFEVFQAAAMKIGASEVQETDNGAVTGGFGGAVATAVPVDSATGGSSSGSSGSGNGATNVDIGFATILLATAGLIASVL
ncbi:hypothetical protein HGRIS_013298 [Hohenbuehelia grisea]|uniref:Blue (type 1) copper domain-containing protein n=1 Tax=Hohenbuehelia grisea TaxID=104357 RepID=A0ABR3IV85_9AGAR